MEYIKYYIYQSTYKFLKFTALFKPSGIVPVI